MLCLFIHSVLFPFLAFRFVFPRVQTSVCSLLLLFLSLPIRFCLPIYFVHPSSIHLTLSSPPPPLHSYIDAYSKPVLGPSRSSVTSRLPFETYRRHPFTHPFTHPLTHSPTAKTTPGWACSVTTKLPSTRRRIMAYRPDHPPLDHCLLTCTLLTAQSCHVALIPGEIIVYSTCVALSCSIEQIVANEYVSYETAVQYDAEQSEYKMITYKHGQCERGELNKVGETRRMRRDVRGLDGNSLNHRALHPIACPPRSQRKQNNGHEGKRNEHPKAYTFASVTVA